MEVVIHTHATECVAYERGSTDFEILLKKEKKVTRAERNKKLRKLPETESYYSCIREERNLVAVIYHLLMMLSHKDLREFLNGLGVADDEVQIGSEADENSGFGIYYEYAFLRDAWNMIGKESTRHEKNEQRRKTIKRLLGDSGWGYWGLEDDAPAELFNKVFQVNHRTSKTFVHSPAKWQFPSVGNEVSDSVIEGDRTANEDDHTERERKEAKLIKLAFNAKPDLVIHTNSEHAVCFEFKCESPASKTDGYHQLEIQKKIFELLNIKVKMFYVVPDEDTAWPPRGKMNLKDVERVTWKKLLEKIWQFESCRSTLRRPFIKEMFKVAKAYAWLDQQN